ncbi:MAG: hypothetical protein NT013_30565 [Planctomycetia bacterium]|nr:hypothetical protein [Planctomycetia bacterium]
MSRDAVDTVAWAATRSSAPTAPKAAAEILIRTTSRKQTATGVSDAAEYFGHTRVGSRVAEQLGYKLVSEQENENR